MDEVIHHNFSSRAFDDREAMQLTSSPSNRHRRSILPAWIIANPTMRRDCEDLEQLGFKIHPINVNGIKTVLFSRADICPVPPRLLNADEARLAHEFVVRERESGRSA